MKEHTPMDDEKKLREIIREELQKLSGMTWGQRLGYIWDYYKPLMAILLGILVLINIGLTIYHNKQQIDVINVYLFDTKSLDLDTDQIASEFADYIGGLKKHEVVTVDGTLQAEYDDSSQYSMAMQVKVMALATNGDMDLVLVKESVYQEYLEEGWLREMDDLLTDEQKEKWSDLLVYDSGAIYGVNVQDASVLQRYDVFYDDEPVYACVEVTASNTELCGTFLDYLFTENIVTEEETGGQNNG
jgi:hypothetical protein